ncbi:ERCC4 domain-containing protein [Thiocystis violascens]|uniref:ERCC4-type nuclease n=1 Tax=Thiocystis violascens (strain ATCC 17096 / DSM 198 / 6111) TaxID=765911 RepID=I3YGC5_THIV6|nr:ERCC4 domain-containing protein [Thiocystis violascens]AFL76043.1 ERCC4-type nuclease [Thiocystis violascens DSM 198]
MEQVDKQSTISVQVDDRESRSAVLDVLKMQTGVDVQVRRLPVGDYLIDDRFLFERKTLIDLTLSIQDGRLFSQGLKLAGSPLQTALILEGTSKGLAGSRMRREAIQGALVSLTLFLGIPLLRAMDSSETARLMLYAVRQGRRFATGAYPRKGRRVHGKTRLQHHILQGLPGIGPSRAKRLLERFGSIEAVVTAAPGELAQIVRNRSGHRRCHSLGGRGIGRLFCARR